MWGEAARQSYDSKTIPEYVRKIVGPVRKYYTTDKRMQRELLVSNIEVNRVENNYSSLTAFNDCRKDLMVTTRLKKTLQ